MSTVDIQYCLRHFITHEELLAKVGITADDLKEWQDAGIFPHSSYTLEFKNKVVSMFEPSPPTSVLYLYPPGSLEWAKKVCEVEQSKKILKLHFAQGIRLGLQQAKEQGIEDPLGLEGVSVTNMIDKHWGHFLNGSYGIGLKNTAPEHIALYGATIRVIDAWLKEYSDAPAISIEQREILKRAVDLLDSICAEQTLSVNDNDTREQYIDLPRQRYLSAVDLKIQNNNTPTA